jgi:hypothetical protein
LGDDKPQLIFFLFNFCGGGGGDRTYLETAINVIRLQYTKQ